MRIKVDSEFRAEGTIFIMEKIIDEYGYASVASLLDCCFIRNDNYMNCIYGWIDMSDAKIEQQSRGWYIVLPDPINLYEYENALTNFAEIEM